MVFRQTVQSQRLLQGVSRLGIAVSGGADSVALLGLLLRLCRERRIEAVVLHLNHGLRQEAAQDARYVEEVAAVTGVKCLSEARPVVLSAGVSLEMAAREVRQAFYAACCEAASLDAVATGHNADDVAETVILRLARGAGLSGIAALGFRSRPSGAHLMIRPLLKVSGKALRGWLRQEGVGWREDESNADTAILRNRVRHEVLPLLEQHLGEGLRASLCRTAEILREEEALLDVRSRKQATICTTGNALRLKTLLKQPLAFQRRIVRRWLFANDAASASGFDSTESLLALCARGAKTRLQLAGGFYAVSDGTAVVLVREATTVAPLVLPTGTPCRWRDLMFLCTPSSGIESVAHGIGSYPAVCTINPVACQGHPLVVRSRELGDRLTPYGMKGMKKVQDLFVDEKVPEHLRDTIPILTCGNMLVWIPGFRIAQPFAVKDASSPCLRIEVGEVAPDG